MVVSCILASYQTYVDVSELRGKCVYTISNLPTVDVNDLLRAAESKSLGSAASEGVCVLLRNG